MSLALIGGKVLYFCHIPKTGGTSIEAYLKSKGRVAMVGRSTDWVRSTPQHLPDYVAKCFVPAGFYDHSFAVLRDPLDRLVSTFQMRAAPDDGVRKANPLFAAMRARGKVLRRKLFRIPVMEREVLIDFDAWVRLILAIHRRRRWIYDNHVSPQTDFVAGDQELFLFENGLEQVYEWIDRVTDTSPADRSLHLMKSTPHRFAISDATRTLVRSRFAKDYALIEQVRSRRKARV